MNKKNFRNTFIILIILISVLIIKVSRTSFLNYEKRIVSQQQEQLFTISKLVGENILSFVKEQGNNIDYLGEKIKIDMLKEDGKELSLERIKKFSNTHENHILGVRYVNFKEGIDHAYPKGTEKNIFIENKKGFYEAMKNYKKVGDIYIGEAYETSKKAYAFDLLKLMYIDGELEGVLVTKLDVNNMYNLIGKSVKGGEYGYTMVKNSDGLIIMHPVKEQVGYDILVDRKKKYPDLDYKELEDLVSRQLSGEEGTYIYHSYWWQNKKLEKVKKFQAFTSVEVTNKFWVVAVTMSYDEIGGAIKKYLYNIILIALTLISIISLAMVIIMKMISTREAHRIETNYLKEINESSKNLREKEIELHNKKKAQTIGILTGGIAHEFNNILTPIMGYSEMILMDIEPEDDFYDEMKIINDSSKRARDVIDQILKFSGNKNMKIEYSFLEINEVVKKALNFFEATTPSNIKVKKNISSGLGTVFANEAQIYQVLLDLCINSYSSMKGSGGELKIDLLTINSNTDELLSEEKMNHKKYIKLSIKSISDNTLMMEGEVRLPTEVEELGIIKSELSSVEEIITKHGGKFFVEKESEKSNRFDVYLPQVEVADEDSALYGRERVLIIDDEEAIVNMLNKSLKELGYKVTTYTNPLEVVRDYNNLKDKIDIVISDIRMPEMTGTQIAKKFRRDNSDIKIILMTGNAEEPLEEYVQSNLIDEYILKPVSVKKICQKIRTVIDEE